MPNEFDFNSPDYTGGDKGSDDEIGGKDRNDIEGIDWSNIIIEKINLPSSI